jgi:hypothetical protein
MELYFVKLHNIKLKYVISSHFKRLRKVLRNYLN